jgi:ribosomal protein S18 acetylase RimI-like enzyme
MISIRTVSADDWQQWRELRREALREAPDAFGSTLAGWSGDGDYEARWRDRLETVPVNLVADLDDVPVGMVSLTAVQDLESELIGMWVAPQARGRGVGKALVLSVLDQARAIGAVTIALDVTAGNEPAIALYVSTGFVDVGWASSPDDPKPERRMRQSLFAPPTAE